MSVRVFPNAATNVARVGSRVWVEDEDGMAEFVLVLPGEVNRLDDHVSTDSPMGRAVLGQPSGVLVAVEAPHGRRRARIVSIEEDDG